MVNEFIEELKLLAKEKFPVKKTTDFIKQYPPLLNYLDKYLFFRDDIYTRNLIYYSPEFELLALCWMPNQKAPAHGHEGEKCWFKVELGTLKIINYDDNSTNDNLIETSQVEAKKGYVDGPAYIHAVENMVAEPAISLHIYARPFHECDVYLKNRKCRKKIGYYSKYGKIVDSQAL